ncbi:MAG: hypothetical protein V4510_11410 [bacterium]
MTRVVAMPKLKRGQKMAYSLDEDEVTLAWDAVRKANVLRGTPLGAPDLVLPAWWWKGTGLVRDDKANLAIRAIATTAGPLVCIHDGAAPDVEDLAKAVHASAPTILEMAWQKVRVAREGPDTEADFPLGAFVAGPRHDDVLAQRMRLGQGKVMTWTTVSAGAAPTEFTRLQDAVGAYHVVLVGLADRARTVGLWTDAAPPQTGQAATPVLRRLFRTQGAWRYGIKFSP